MDNGKFTAFCAGTGTLGGTMKASLLSGPCGMSVAGAAEVMFYAALSALAAYLTKVGLDRLFGRIGRKGGGR